MKKQYWISLIMILILILLNINYGYGENIEKKDVTQEKKIFLKQKQNSDHSKKIEKTIISAIDDKLKRNTSIFSQYNTLDFVNNRLRIEVILTDEQQVNALRNFSDDITIENHYNALAQVLLPVNQILNLSKEKYVQYIRNPVKAIPAVTSEGVAVIHADIIQNVNFTGAGVKVAIIDIGFKGYALNPDVPSARIKEKLSFRADHNFEYDEHGTACAEILLDVAPQADLYLYNFNTISELNTAVSRAIAVGVDIISFSIGYTALNNFNGTGYAGLGDVCSIVNNARAHGILFVVAAGNEAAHHYEGTWTDTNSNNYHEFSSNDEELNLGYLTAGTEYHFELTWDDWPYSDQDYDLILYDSQYNLVDWSADPQTGSQPPRDWIANYIPYNDSYYLDIYRYNATRAVNFELYGDDLISFTEYNYPESSLTCPADATGATSVGATYWADDSLQNYSSRGPTNDGRIKPDITAPDGVSTYINGANNFFGTSASAPHVAGTAALLLSADSTLTADQLDTILETTAIDLELTGKDNLTGAGRIDAWNAFNSSMVNKIPVAIDDYYTLNEDLELIVTAPGVLSNDTDGDNDLLSVIPLSNPAHGTLTMFNNNGSFTYIPTANYYGSDAFRYQIFDGTVYSNSATVYLAIIPVNDPPVVGNIPNQTILEGATFAAITLDNYVSDIDNTDPQITWTYSGNTNLQVNIVNRIATIAPPNTNWSGTETILFRATDSGGLSNTDSATFTITAVNDPPIVSGIPDQTIPEGESFTTINLDGYVTDVDNTDAEMTWTYTGNSHLMIRIVDRSATISIPHLDWYGKETITFNARDSLGLSDIDTAIFTVLSVNDPPIVNFTVQPTNPEPHETVFFNSTSYDIDGTISNYTWNFGDGTKAYKQKVTHQYTENNPYTITLNITDNNGSTNTIQKTIRVSPNEPPTITNPSPLNNSPNIPLSANLTWIGEDPNYETLTYDVYFGPTSSPTKVKSNQSATTYDPGTLQLNTTYYWKIVAWDPHQAQNISIWHFTTRTNAPPITNPNNYSTNEDTTLTITAPGVLGDDTDSNNDPLTAVKVSNTLHGSITLNANGSFTYVPFANYYGGDMFSYKAYDGFVYSSAVNVTITINAVNDPPIFGTSTPADRSTVNQLSLTWSILIFDLESDNITWTIQCSNGQSTNSTGSETDGIKTLLLSGLVYSTTYKIWVNATDPTGSKQYTKKWYTFTPKSSNGGNPQGDAASEEPTNKKPIANASAGEPYKGYINSEITFDGSRSFDPDGNITKWFWVFGDNINGTGKTIQHTYTKVGNYTVSLTVTDNEGAAHTVTTTCVIIQSNRPPTVPIINGSQTGTKNTVYVYTAVSTDADNDTIRYTITWGDETSYANNSVFLPSGSPFTCTHNWSTAGRYHITVRATDNQTESFSNFTVYIDAKKTGNIGYLIDQDGDGFYDFFYSDISQQTTPMQKKDHNYNIDSNGDGTWDYSYDEVTGLMSYQEPKTPGFELILVLYAIAVMLLRRKKNRG